MLVRGKFASWNAKQWYVTVANVKGLQLITSLYILLEHCAHHKLYLPSEKCTYRRLFLFKITDYLSAYFFICNFKNLWLYNVIICPLGITAWLDKVHSQTKDQTKSKDPFVSLWPRSQHKSTWRVEAALVMANNYSHFTCLRNASGQQYTIKHWDLKCFQSKLVLCLSHDGHTFAHHNMEENWTFTYNESVGPKGFQKGFNSVTNDCNPFP